MTDINKNSPYVENYPVLEEWLDRWRAKHLWSAAVEISDGRHSRYSQRIVSAYNVNGAACLVVVEANQRGWQIYTANDSNVITDTLLDAEQRVGLRQG